MQLNNAFHLGNMRAYCVGALLQWALHGSLLIYTIVNHSQLTKASLLFAACLRHSGTALCYSGGQL